MPNGFAYLMLLVFPVAACIMFRRMSRPAAVVWVILAGYLLLPTNVAIDLPMMPAINKTLMPSMMALALCLLMAPRRTGREGVVDAPDLAGWAPKAGWVKLLVALFVLGPPVTVLLNDFPIRFGNLVSIRALTFYDAASTLMGRALILVPFLLGRRYLASEENQKLLLRILFVAGLAYTLPVLFEIRFSPQLHRWIYGFHQHSFGQQFRDGGFRSMVFLQHGLVVAIFMCMTLIACAGLWRTAGTDARRRLGWAIPLLAVTLVLSKSVGALGLGLLFAPVALLAGKRFQLFVAGAVALAVLIYPALRGADLVPTEQLLSAARSIDPERAGSLNLRFENEDMLLARANERPVMGWGIWGRSRVYNEATGADISVTDGFWVITIGQFGWAGYLATFGLMALPAVALYRRRADPALTMTTATLALVLSVNLVDMLPNSSFGPLTLLIAGALLGRAEMLSSGAAATAQSRPRATNRRRRRTAGDVAEDPGRPAPEEPAPGPASGRASGLRPGPKSGAAPAPSAPRPYSRPVRPIRPVFGERGK